MADGLDMACKAMQCPRIIVRAISQAGAFCKIEFDARLQASVRTHAALPGHGSATAERLRLSNLA